MVKTEKDVDLIIGYVKSASELQPNKAMLETLLKSNAMQVRVWEEQGIILGLRAFVLVPNPFQGAMGFALVQDFANGYEIEPDQTR